MNILQSYKVSADPSSLTGGRNQPRQDPRLLNPTGDRLCRCLPGRLLRRSRSRRREPEDNANVMEDRATRVEDAAENSPRVTDLERTRDDFL